MSAPKLAQEASEQLLSLSGNCGEVNGQLDMAQNLRDPGRVQESWVPHSGPHFRLKELGSTDDI